MRMSVSVLFVTGVVSFAACTETTDPVGAGGEGGLAGSAGSAGSMSGGAGGASGGGATGGSAGSNTCGTPARASYAFTSRFDGGSSSVNHGGQTARHVLIAELTSYVGGLTEAIDGGGFLPAAQGDVVGVLDTYFKNPGEVLDAEPLSYKFGDAELLPATLGDISTGKNLVGKLAGNDSTTDHKDWLAGGFVGWTDASIASDGGGIDTPENLVVALFSTLERQAIDRANGTIPKIGTEELPVHVTSSGLDLQQLIQKFLLGAVAFSQGTDDYLDDDVDGKGLLSPNARDEMKTYTVLEHAWDEGFGYFGATWDYDDYSDDEIAAKDGRPEYQGAHDFNADCKLNPQGEIVFGAAANAAKRDRDSASSAATDYTAHVFSAFLAGRALIRDAGEQLTPAELAELKTHRDAAVLGWEKAIAATVVHYINDVLQDMTKFGTVDYAVLDHAKHWSELKGFALTLQFNPRSQLSDTDFASLHASVGDAPVLESATTADADAYRVALRAARAVLASAYGFAAANVGDDNGLDGW